MENLVPVQVKGNVGTIEDNLELVEASIRAKVEEYKAVVVTEDTIKDGKKLLADIRKEKTALDNERKEIKAKWMAPFNAFEEKAKRIISLYDEPVNVINGQLAAYEEDRKKLKRQGIQSIYDFVKGDLGEWLPLERIYNPKWENATCKDKKIREDMELIFDQMKVSISTIKSMNSEFEEDALRVLKETGSLQSAIAQINDLQKQKERFLEQARREEEQKRLEEERKRQEAEQKRLEAEQRQAEAERKCLEAEQNRPETEQEPPKAEQMAMPAAEQETGRPAGPEAGSGEAFGSAEMIESPFAMEKIYTVIVKVGENDFDTFRDSLEACGFEYEVRM